MTFSAGLRRHRIVALSILAACGGSKAQPSGSGRDAVVAGGESSEFGGDSPYCQAVSMTPLDRSAESVAPWVALAEGHHEVGFSWQRLYLTDTITGFQDETRASLDVSVLGAYQANFGAYCPIGPRALQLELEVALATADGALEGTFRHWVGTTPSPAPALGEPLRTYWSQLPRIFAAPLDDFTSSLEYGVDLAAQARRELSVQLRFDGAGVSGMLRPFLAPPTAEGGGWSPIMGVFPDDGCAARGPRIDLDATASGFAETPRALYERAVSLWHEGPIAGDWGDGTRTQIQLSAGEPIVACQLLIPQGFAGIVVDGPVRLETDDGRVALEQTVQLHFGPDATAAQATSGWPQLWIAFDQFEPVTGIKGVHLAAGEFGSVDFSNDFDFAGSSVSGVLYVNKASPTDSRSADYPSLSW